MESEKRNSTIKRAFALIHLLSNSPEGLSFTYLKLAMNNISSTTLSRLLKYLMEEEVVENTKNGNYILGQNLKSLVSKIMEKATFEEILKPFVEYLSEKTGQSVAFAVIEGNNLVLKAKFEQPGSFHYMALNELSEYVYENGFGLVCLAHQKKSKRQEILDATIPDDFYKKSSEIKAELDRIRLEKCTVFTYKEFLIKRIIAPVFACDTKKIVGAIGITLFVRDSSDNYKNYVEQVRLTAEKISGIIREN